jgi:hypothetical protein
MIITIVRKARAYTYADRAELYAHAAGVRA